MNKVLNISLSSIAILGFALVLWNITPTPWEKDIQKISSFSSTQEILDTEKSDANKDQEVLAEQQAQEIAQVEQQEEKSVDEVQAQQEAEKEAKLAAEQKVEAQAAASEKAAEEERQAEAKALAEKQAQEKAAQENTAKLQAEKNQQVAAEADAKAQQEKAAQDERERQEKAAQEAETQRQAEAKALAEKQAQDKAAAEAAAAAAAAPKTLASGSFQTVQVGTSGSVKFVESNGKQTIQISNLSTSAAPNLEIYLSKAGSISSSAGIPWSIKLTALRSPKWSQTYSVPGNIDLSQYRSIAIHCTEYNKLFGSASLR